MFATIDQGSMAHAEAEQKPPRMLAFEVRHGRSELGRWREPGVDDPAGDLYLVRRSEQLFEARGQSRLKPTGYPNRPVPRSLNLAGGFDESVRLPTAPPDPYGAEIHVVHDTNALGEHSAGASLEHPGSARSDLTGGVRGVACLLYTSRCV